MKRKSAPGSSNKRAVKKAKRVFVPRVRQGEVKGVDTLLSLNPIIATTTTNASSFVLNLVPPGTASYNRVGRKTYAKSLRLRGQLVFTMASQASSFDMPGNYVRMVVVWDKQPSGAQPNFNDIFGVTAQDGTESSTLLAPVRYDNMDRFRVIRDCVINCNPDVIPSGGSTNQNEKYVAFDEYIKLGGKETVYSGQTATQTIADISTGALYVYFRAGLNTATTAFALVDQASFARLRYTD